VAAWLKFGDTAEYLPQDYNDTPPDVRGRQVFILDLSFPAETLSAMAEVAESIELEDHHVTATKKLAGFKLACCGRIHFDLDQCGCVLAWKLFHPDKPVPQVFLHIQDRDRWTWELPESKAFLTWLDTQPLDFETWKRILELTPLELTNRANLGLALAEQMDGLCKSIARSAAPITIGEHQGLMVNCSGEFRSEVGSLLAAQCGTFGLVWRISEKGTVLCSLRSLKSFDVEALAIRFPGGGGHPTAASFTLEPEHLLELVHGHLELPLAPTGIDEAQ
jgi:uncharacterized protein